MILVRIAISIFAFCLLGVALSLSSAHSQQDARTADMAMVTAR